VCRRASRYRPSLDEEDVAAAAPGPFRAGSQEALAAVVLLFSAALLPACYQVLEFLIDFQIGNATRFLIFLRSLFAGGSLFVSTETQGPDYFSLLLQREIIDFEVISR